MGTVCDTGLMHEPVAHARFVYVARLRVADGEMLVAAVAVCPLHQVSVERENIRYETPPKFLHVSALMLPFHEFSPCVKKILDGDDILVCKTP